LVVRGKEAFLTGLVAALLIGASPAHAGECDWPVAQAHATHQSKDQPAPLVIGDSTMVFSVEELAARGFDANARVCRSWTEGVTMLKQRKRAGRLPSIVVMALGANSWVRPIDVQRALKVIGRDRKLVLMTHRTWFGKPGPDTGVIRRMARRYRKRVELLDWVRYAAPHPNWFINDGLHTTKLGSRKFAAFIARVLS
jgi:hypothetical protein